MEKQKMRSPLQLRAARLVRAKFLVGSITFMMAMLTASALQGTTYALANDLELLGDVHPGAASSYQTGSFTKLGSDVYYLNTDDNTYQLWKTDGVTGEAQLVKTICNDCTGYEYNGLTQTNGKLIIKATDGLWASDGTEAGTAHIKNIGQIENFTTLNGDLFFLGTAENDPSHMMVWQTDGTESGTNTLNLFGDESIASNMVATSDLVYTTTYDLDTDTYKLWSFDGEPATLLRTVNSDPNNGSGMFWMTAVGSKLYFTYDTVTYQEDHMSGSSSSQLWSSDGTVAGTAMVADLQQSGSVRPKIEYLQSAGQNVMFVADDGEHGSEPWISDGTEAGTHMVADINPGEAGSNVMYAGTADILNGKIYFTADDGVNGSEPWYSDGTAEGTAMLKDVLPGSEGSWAGQYHVIGDKVYFTAPDAELGWEWWQSDGTAESTHMAVDTNPGLGDADMFNDTVIDGALYFVANDGTHGYEPFVLR